MPWQERNTMSLRLEFVTLARKRESNVRELCRRFGISPQTGYKWLRRFAAEGVSGLKDRSRRPRRSPRRTPRAMEQAVLALRDRHRVWSGRKIRRRLLDLGYEQVPAASTIVAILRRHGRLEDPDSTPSRPWRRFEADQPNVLWQMDYKGHFPLPHGRCHPLTVLDDCSRYSLTLRACANQRTATVKEHLAATFQRYGLPEQMLMDNGSPWGSDAEHRWTPLTVWMVRLGITPIHSRPYHPQTLGKEERFHRTLKAELLRHRRFRDLEHAQGHFDTWRRSYNFERPHEALDLEVPANRYRPSDRSFPRQLSPIEYAPQDSVRKVQARGEIFLEGKIYRVPKAFRGQRIALRPTTDDGILKAYFCHAHIATINLREPCS